MDMSILLLGSGGREHALARALSISPYCYQVYIAPGNGGTAECGINVDCDINDPEAVADLCRKLKIDFCVIGPEAPLVAGVADKVRSLGIPVVGPGKTGAQLEGSKRFAKEFMVRHGIPTAAYGAFSDEQEALDFIDSQNVPLVVKADGLAAGKGVYVTSTPEEAKAAVKECFAGRFGDSGKEVVIEERLEGPECSLLVMTDGKHMIPLALAQDHKRVGEGDTGPNTGGMGVYSPVPLVSDEEYQQMLDAMQKSVEGIAADELDFRGVLYGGFMLTKDGPKVLEYNVRFGDPETQVIIPRLASDIFELLYLCAEGRLNEHVPQWNNFFAVSVVLASEGYPGSYETGKVITGIDEAEKLGRVRIYHAGTKRVPVGDDGDYKLVTSGGRVLAVTGLGSTFEQAREHAYAACDKINFEGKYLRRDIGARMLTR